MTDARRVQVGTLLAVSMVSALVLMRPATAADYFARQFLQVRITPQIQDLGQYEVKVAVLDGLANPRHRDLRGQIDGVFGLAAAFGGLNRFVSTPPVHIQHQPPRLPTLPTSRFSREMARSL